MVTEALPQGDLHYILPHIRVLEDIWVQTHILLVTFYTHIITTVTTLYGKGEGSQIKAFSKLKTEHEEMTVVVPREDKELREQPA